MKQIKKWFYPVQERLSKHMEYHYSSFVCQSQDVCGSRVFEVYVVHEKGTNRGLQIVVMMLQTYGQEDGSFFIYEQAHEKISTLGQLEIEGKLTSL